MSTVRANNSDRIRSIQYVYLMNVYPHEQFPLMERVHISERQDFSQQNRLDFN